VKLVIFDEDVPSSTRSWRAYRVRVPMTATANGERKYGEKYSQAVEENVGSYGSLRNAVYVSERFDLSRRRDNLSWSHHAEVAALDPHEQNDWLDRAERRAGEMLAAMPKNEGGRPVTTNTPLPVTDPPTLADVGMQSSRWQAVASVPAPRGAA
jgi:hypothetical protein